MTIGEDYSSAQQPNFEDAVDLISKLVKPHTVGSSDEYGEVEFPGWDGSIRKLDLEPEVAAQTGLGDSVRARVIGDYESGIAIIMRSRNLFDVRRFGFYVQPTHNEAGVRGLEVWQAPASKPKHGELYWGIELLDRQKAQQSSPEVTRGLIKSLGQNV
jgi:hypothetical protein